MANGLVEKQRGKNKATGGN
jgi:hypothetical protein